jgi:hypothetical protein
MDTMPRNKWPTEVPILTAEDMCKKQLYGPYGTACLVGHARRTFNAYDASIKDRGIFGQVYKALLKTCSKREDAVYTFYEVAVYNDSHTLAENAKVWNEAIAALGYTEIEDA